MSTSSQYLSKMDDDKTTGGLCSDIKSKLVLEKVEEKIKDVGDLTKSPSIEVELSDPPLAPPTTLVKWVAVARVKLKDVKGNWKERSACLKILQDLCKRDLVTKDEISREENWDILLPLMRIQILDLRSAVMREACKTVQVMSEHAQTRFGPFVSSILPTLVEQSSSGNKVISRYATSALLAVVENSCPTKTIDSCLEYIVSSKNKKVRSIATKVAEVVIRCYESLDQSFDVVEKIITIGQADAAVEVCFFFFFPLSLSLSLSLSFVQGRE
jgi:hypothetical protein